MTERTEMDPAALSRLLDVARGALAGLRGQFEQDQADSEPATEEIRGEGVAGDGHVRVTIDHNGTVLPVQLDRNARGLGSEELAAQVVMAYNAAREDLRRQLEEETRSGAAPDPYELNEKLLEAQSEALRQSLAIIDSFERSTRNLARAAGTDSDTE